MTRNYKWLLISILFLKLLFSILWIPPAEIGLAPDEAQYWTWSQQLGWGYYSKPPGVAWQIKLGTLLFGDTEFGVRFIALIFSFLLPLAIFYLAKACRQEDRIAFFAGIAFAFSPIGIFSSFLATTDGGMLLFWTLACISTLSSQNYYITGLMILCGALFKWPIYLLWIPIIIYGPRSKQMFWGILISLFGLFPSLVWNATHDWVTFRHVLTQTVEGGKTAGNFVAFFGAQAALVSPILFILLLISFIRLKKSSRELFFCGGISFIVLAVFFSLSFFKKMQGNWCLYAYPTAFVYVAATQLKTWFKIGIVLSVVLTAAVLSIPYLDFPYKMNPLKHNLGWKQLGKELEKVGYNSEEDVLLADKYQTTSILSFYAPGQKRAYFLNLHGARKNQFLFWPGMKEGDSGYFVLVENSPHLGKDPAHYIELLKEYFLDVKFLGVKSLYEVSGEMVKGAFLFKCTHYNGHLPVTPDIF